MAIPRMYCPECGNYLLNPVGECNDCHCGYRQPVQPESEVDCEYATTEPAPTTKESEDGK